MFHIRICMYRSKIGALQFHVIPSPFCSIYSLHIVLSLDHILLSVDYRNMEHKGRNPGLGKSVCIHEHNAIK